MRVAALVVCGAIAGCRLLGGIPEHPSPAQVEAVSLRLGEDGRGLLTLRLSYRNAEAKPTLLSSAEWELALEGRQFASGKRGLAEEVPARTMGTVTFEVPLVFRPMPLTPSAVDALVRVHGRLAVGGGTDPPLVPFLRTLLVTTRVPTPEAFRSD